MLGEIMSLRRSSAPAPSDNSNTPSFPLYLLPSLRIPFRRHRISEPAAGPSRTASSSDPPSLSSSPASSASPNSPTTPTSGTRRLSRTLPDTLRCSTCSADLAFRAQIISKGFQGRHGRAYLVSPHCPLASVSASATTFASSPSSPSSPPHSPVTCEQKKKKKTTTITTDLVNIRVGKPENRRLATGPHVVADISCAVCSSTVGWKYVDAGDPSQQYKVGKFILETRRVVGFHSWEDVEVRVMDGGDEARSIQGEGGQGDEEAVVFDSDDEDECDDIFAGVWDAKEVARRRMSRVTNRRPEGGAA